MKRAFTLTIATALLVGAWTPAWAWGPKTRVAIVTTAARLLSKESGANLTRLERDIRTGASISPSELANLIPIAATDTVGAIETEMYLLQAVGRGRVDPYLAYRLGVLGNLVAQATAPLADAEPAIRDLYYSDVEGTIERVQLKPAPRTQVDPSTYFIEAQNAANQRRELILTDYRAGIGFKGTASAALSEDASRSVNAVADVFQAVLLGRVASANISPSQIRDYVVEATRFYIRRGNDAETDAAYRRLSELDVMTIDLQKQIGDMFYDAGKYERAMREYQAVLAVDPSRRDVSERIASYYVKLGDDAVAEKRLEDAQEAYQNALNADKLHPTAQRKLLDADKMIQERDARLAAVRDALAAAESKINEAEQRAFRRDYGGAIALLHEAQESYEQVTDEFAAEYRAAQNGMLTAETRLSQLRQDLVNNAPSLSGLGGGAATRQQAADAARAVEQAALQQMLDTQYQQELNRLKSETTVDVAP